MPYALVQDAAVSWQHYRELGPALLEPVPPGLLLHVAGPTAEGIRIIDIWQAKDAWERFHEECLAPALAALGEPVGAELTFRDLEVAHFVGGRRNVEP